MKIFQNKIRFLWHVYVHYLILTYSKRENLWQIEWQTQFLHNLPESKVKQFGCHLLDNTIGHGAMGLPWRSQPPLLERAHDKICYRISIGHFNDSLLIVPQKVVKIISSYLTLESINWAAIRAAGESCTSLLNCGIFLQLK